MASLDVGSAAALLDPLTSLVSAAAASILDARAGVLATRAKADLSPVTAADEAAEAVLLAGLANILPGVTVVSEEAAGRAPATGLAEDFVLLDPLDGTRELIAGRDEFTVNLALTRGGRPWLGIIAAPARGLVWRGAESAGAERLELAPGDGAAAARRRVALRTRRCPPADLAAAVSRSHLDLRTEAFLARLPLRERRACGSALKFCQLAEGMLDIYPRLGTTCEWDVAAGEALLTAAGGAVTTPDGAQLSYGGCANGFRIPAFIAWGDPAAPARFLGR